MNQHVIEAKKIHASLLDGLIPVQRPRFIDGEGDERECRTEHLDNLDTEMICRPFDWEIIRWRDDTLNDEQLLWNLPLIMKSVSKAKSLDWKYLLSITIMRFIRESEGNAGVISREYNFSVVIRGV